jgi:GT2 family glycosyltransferase
VTALLVSHDGERWLRAVLDGLAEQTRPVDGVLAVDTGSTDASPRLLRDRLGDSAVLSAPAGLGYGGAVDLGLAALPPASGDEWVWLLHDDSAPAADALEQLLAVAAAEPSADILGPKLREWPSLRRLLEVGVTISGTGARETGLESGEYDQGQHDRVKDVLAVNTAGMLVRRSVLASLGLDPRLPVFGNDLDLGWRAARGGHRTVVVPDAVVFHVEAARRGVRRTPLTGRPRRGQRAAALYVLLVNGPAVTLPVRVVRLALGTLLRALGLLLVRAPAEAADEVAALAATYLRPGRVLAGRRDRRRSPGSAGVPHRDVRPLLAPWWLPYRHGLDAVTDLATALVHEAADVSAARRARAATGAGPAGTSAPGLPGPLEARPGLWLVAGLLVIALVSARGLVGSGALSGGALLPAPDSAFDWWRGYLGSWHPTGTGSSAPAAPYLLPMAVLGTVLLGQAGLVVDLLFLLAVPLAAWGGYRLLVRLTSSRLVSGWGAVAYGVLPVVTGAVQEGRLGTVAGAVVLPWLAHSALFLRAGESADRRARAAWRTALWLALLTAFVPVAWALAAAVAAVALVSTRGAGWRVMLTPLLASLVLLLPWSVGVWGHQGAASLLFEAGLPAPSLTGALTSWDALLGRPGGGAPGWLSAGVVAAAVLALVRSDTRPVVLRAWVVVVVALAGTALLAGHSFSTTTSPLAQPLWLGFPLVLAQGAAITAVALAGARLRVEPDGASDDARSGRAGVGARSAGRSFGRLRPLVVLAVAAAAMTPVACAAWWVWSGSAGPLDRGPATEVPSYMSQAAAADPADGVLVVRGSRADGFSYVLLRGGGVRLGDDYVLPPARDQSGLTAIVEDLVSSPAASDIAALARHGVAYVYAPRPVDLPLVANLDSVSGLAPGSASGRGDRAWQLEAAPLHVALPTHGDPARPWLLAVQGLAVAAALVLAAPSVRRSR